MATISQEAQVVGVLATRPSLGVLRKATTTAGLSATLASARLHRAVGEVAPPIICFIVEALSTRVPAITTTSLSTKKATVLEQATPLAFRLTQAMAAPSQAAAAIKMENHAP